MGPISLIFGAASVVVLGLALFSKDRMAPWLALMLLSSWGLWQVLPKVFPIPQAWAGFPLFDLGCFVVTVILAAGTKQGWLWLLAMTFMGQLIDHGAFWVNWLQLGSAPDKYAAWRLEVRYVLILNLLFAAQLACVAWPGVRHGMELVRSGHVADLHPGGRRPS